MRSAYKQGWLEGARLPDGWDSSRTADNVAVIHAPGIGYVTIDFAVRAFRLGSVHVRRTDKDKSYTGRGWRATLVQDAVDQLRGVIR